MCSVKENIIRFRGSKENEGLSLQEINKKMLFKFEVLITEDGNRMLVMPADIAGIRGKVTIYIKVDGTAYKAVLSDVIELVGIKPTSKSVRAEGETFYVYNELGTASNSSGYRAVKVPYSEAVWQPYKHMLVAYAFGLIRSPYDECVINHIASRSYGDSLGNIEVVSQSDNVLCGQFVNKVMGEFSFITYMSLSARQAHILKHFIKSIRELVSRIEELPTQVGSEFILDDIRYKLSPESIQINCKLKNREYDNHMLIVIERSLYENS